jgi:hypothetical protein
VLSVVCFAVAAIALVRVAIGGRGAAVAAA